MRLNNDSVTRVIRGKLPWVIIIYSFFFGLMLFQFRNFEELINPGHSSIFRNNYYYLLVVIFFYMLTIVPLFIQLNIKKGHNNIII
jgi:hypothetical protein